MSLDTAGVEVTSLPLMHTSPRFLEKGTKVSSREKMSREPSFDNHSYTNCRNSKNDDTVSTTEESELCTLVFSNLTRTVTEDHIREIASCCGTVACIKKMDPLPKRPLCKRYAVRFLNNDQALAVMKHLNGGQIDGQVVRISWLERHNGDAEASRTRVEPRRPVKVTHDRDRRSVSDRSEESWDSRGKSPRRAASDKKRRPLERQTERDGSPAPAPDARSTYRRRVRSVSHSRSSSIASKASRKASLGKRSALSPRGRRDLSSSPRRGDRRSVSHQTSHSSRSRRSTLSWSSASRSNRSRTSNRRANVRQKSFSRSLSRSSSRDRYSSRR